MTQPNAKPDHSSDSRERCRHRTATGRRCRILAADSQSAFCGKHQTPAEHPAAIAATLTADLDDFTSAAQINDFLSRLLLLLAQDKISTRRAAVLTYITAQLLRTIPAIEKEEGAIPMLYDAPRPDRSDPEDSKANPLVPALSDATPPAPEVRA